MITVPFYQDKMKTYFFNFLVSVIAVLAPLQTAICAIGFLIFSDLLMGLLAAYKTGDPITSRRLKDTGIKALIYNLLVISGFIAQKYMVAWIPFTKIILAFLAIVEIYSIGESFQKITGLPFIKYLKEHINRYLNSGKDAK